MNIIVTTSMAINVNTAEAIEQDDGKHTLTFTFPEKEYKYIMDRIKEGIPMTFMVVKESDEE